MADAAFRKGYAPGDRMICMTSAVAGGRAAAVLRRRSS
jgi:3-oxoacyl-[acyl-carrier-protein] synthase-1